MVSASDVGLILSGVPFAVHNLLEAGWLFPMSARNIVNVRAFTGLPLKREEALTYDDQQAMLGAALRAPEVVAKQEAASDWLFLLTMEGRQQSVGWLALFVGSMVCLRLPPQERAAVHIMHVATAACMLVVNLSHVGVPFFGHNPTVTATGKRIGILFTPFWCLMLTLHMLALRDIEQD